MTVLRREDVHSRGASWDRCPYRMSRSPILTIVPLIIRRLRGPSPARITIVQRLRSVPLVRPAAMPKPPSTEPVVATASAPPPTISG